MSRVKLAVNGRIYEGWKEVSIRTGLKAVSGVFSLSITDRWSSQREPWIISPGDECSLSIDDQPIITGFTDSLDTSFDKSSRTISVSGRDKTADIVDCSIDIQKNQFNGQKLEQIAKALVKPFGLSVVMIGDSGAPFNETKIQEGESCFESLERLARMRGFLLTTDGLGKLIITRPSSKRSTTALEEGVNIFAAGVNYNDSDRFSDYTVKGQTGSFSEELSAGVQFGVKASSRDRGIRRYRPFTVIAEQGSTQAEAQIRANWEATVRAAKAAKFRMSVYDWTKADGSLWKPNELVRVKSPWIGIDGDLLISGVSFGLSDSTGTITQLELERPDAYKPEPSISEKSDPLAAAIRKETGR